MKYNTKAPFIPKIHHFLSSLKYELLLVALLLHMFIGFFFMDLAFYTKYIWPINMLILGVSSIGVYIEKGKWKRYFKNFMLSVVIILPMLFTFFENNVIYMKLVGFSYTFFFSLIFYEIMIFLIRPSQVNGKVIAAAMCGFLLLLEICVFGLQYLYYNDPSCIAHLDTSSKAATYADLVYFCSIVLTTIGFGDITPSAHYTKLIVSLMGITGQFYSVIIVGILVSKFSSSENSNVK